MEARAEARTTIAPRAVDGRFVKGLSGNPGGRKPVPYDVVKLAQSRTAVAIDTLTEVCLNKKANAGARVMAASVLLDRAWGKAIQRSETKSLNVNLSELTDGQLLAMLQELHPGATLPGLPAPETADTISAGAEVKTQQSCGDPSGAPPLRTPSGPGVDDKPSRPKRRRKRQLTPRKRKGPIPPPAGPADRLDPGDDGDGSPRPPVKA